MNSELLVVQEFVFLIIVRMVYYYYYCGGFGMDCDGCAGLWSYDFVFSVDGPVGSCIPYDSNRNATRIACILIFI